MTDGATRQNQGCRRPILSGSAELVTSPKKLLIHRTEVRHQRTSKSDPCCLYSTGPVYARHGPPHRLLLFVPALPPAT